MITLNKVVHDLSPAAATLSLPLSLSLSLSLSLTHTYTHTHTHTHTHTSGLVLKHNTYGHTCLENPTSGVAVKITANGMTIKPVTKAGAVLTRKEFPNFMKQEKECPCIDKSKRLLNCTFVKSRYVKKKKRKENS